MRFNSLDPEQREWLEQILLKKTESSILWNNALLAAELVALGAALAWIAITSSVGFSTSDLTFLSRLGLSAAMLLRRFVLVILFVILCMAATLAARWASSTHRSGATFALLVFSPIIIPVAILVVEQFLFVQTGGNLKAADAALEQNPPVGMLLLLLAVLASYTLWKCWWHTFIQLLSRHTDVDVKAEMKKAFAPREYDWRTQAQRYVELKREVLLEKKRRLEGNWEDTRTLKQTPPEYGRDYVQRHGWPVIAALAVAVALFFLWPRPTETPALPPRPPELRLWFSGSREESTELVNLAEEYASVPENLPVVCSNLPDLPSEVHRAFATQNLPDVILADTAFLEYLASNGLLLHLDAGEGETSVSYYNLSSERAWRPQISLAVFDGTPHPNEARKLVDFLALALRERLK